MARKKGGLSQSVYHKKGSTIRLSKDQIIKRFDLHVFKQLISLHKNSRKLTLTSRPLTNGGFQVRNLLESRGKHPIFKGKLAVQLRGGFFFMTDSHGGTAFQIPLTNINSRTIYWILWVYWLSIIVGDLLVWCLGQKLHILIFQSDNIRNGSKWIEIVLYNAKVWTKNKNKKNINHFFVVWSGCRLNPHLLAHLLVI